MLIMSTIAAILFYVYALAMDLAVSYTVYKYDPYFFMNHEANGYFVRSLYGDISSLILVTSASMMFVVLPPISLLIYFLIDDRHRTIKRYCALLILMMDLIVFVVGILHIEGVCSWIMT